MVRDTGARRRLPARERERRAQSSVIGVALLFGIVVTGAVSVVALGAVALNDTKEQLSVQRAQKVLTEFDSEAALVALGNTDVQSVSFGDLRADSFETQNGSGWMRITIENQTDGTTDTTLNQTLGAITYEGTDVSLAYQGGGVWKQSGAGSVMVSPPEFHFRNGTLTLPVVSVSGTPSLDSRASVYHEETVKKYPNVSADEENPLTNHEVTVTVKSEYYQGWGHYFEERTDGEVAYDHGRNIVNLTLVSPIGKRKITAAASSLSASGTFEIQGSTNGECNNGDYTDSYNSSGTSDDYCDQFPFSTGNNGDIVYGKDVDISSGAGTDDIRGDIVAGKDVIVPSSAGLGQPEVYGHINHTEDCRPSDTDCENAIVSGQGTRNEINGVGTVAPINSYVESTVADINDSNDNSTPQIVDDELDYGGVTTRTLGAGTYYLERIDMSASQTLELDTSSGDVTLAVDEDIDLAGSGFGGATIRVTGDGTARIYVNGSGVGTGDHIYMAKNADIVAPDDNAPQIRVYGKEDFNLTLDGGGANLAKFVGVVYAPPGSDGTGTVDVGGGEIYGGVLTGTTTIDDGSIHFDEALVGKPIISANAKVLKITYLHVSINRIRVD